MNDTCLLQIYIPALPPGINGQYTNAAGNSSRKVLTKAARDFNTLVRDIAAREVFFDQAALRANMRNGGYLETNRSLIDSVRRHRKTTKLCLTLRAYLHTIRMDEDACIKQVQDRLAEILSINDMHFFEVHIYKYVTPDQPHIEAEVTWIALPVQQGA